MREKNKAKVRKQDSTINQTGVRLSLDHLDDSGPWILPTTTPQPKDHLSHITLPYLCCVPGTCFKDHWPHWRLQRCTQVKRIPCPLSQRSSDRGLKNFGTWYSPGHEDWHRAHISGLINEGDIPSPWAFSRKQIAQLRLAVSLGLQRKLAWDWRQHTGCQSREADKKKPHKILDKQTHAWPPWYFPLYESINSLIFKVGLNWVFLYWEILPHIYII